MYKITIEEVFQDEYEEDITKSFTYEGSDSVNSWPELLEQFLYGLQSLGFSFSEYPSELAKLCEEVNRDKFLIHIQAERNEGY